MQMADREGIAVIDESPAVGVNTWDNNTFTDERCNKETLAHHLDVMRELVARDKNHPCVVMWSVANESASHEKAAVPYFRKVAQVTRKLDPTRPITLVTCYGSSPDYPEVFDKCVQFFDVVCANRYYGWYSECGQIDVIAHRMEYDMRTWYKTHKKPVLLSEFGADTIAGLHRLPSVMFTEEYQVEFYKESCKALDRCDFVIGEHVWNFADFATSQGVRRVDGNKKGLFTRDRQPKAAAHWFRERWQGKK